MGAVLAMACMAVAGIARADCNTMGRSGVASWYGDRHAGRLTKSGERFDPEGMTAASPHLKPGTRIKVTRVRTGQSVIVRINDRLPPKYCRVLDLAARPARALGMERDGIARVRWEVVE